MRLCLIAGSIAVDFTTERMAWGLATTAASEEELQQATAAGVAEAVAGKGTMQIGIDAKPRLT